MFYSLLVKRDVIPAPVGSSEQAVFIEKMDDSGVMHLEISSYTNLYEKIQAAKDATDVNNIVRRLGGVDMVAAAYPNKGQYIDVVGMPTSLIEAEKVLTNFQNQFDELPSDVRKQFNNNPFEFVAYADAMLKQDANSQKKSATVSKQKDVSDPKEDINV